VLCAWRAALRLPSNSKSVLLLNDQT
jgi:hypothetical protein